jgi:hypothetical protein
MGSMAATNAWGVVGAFALTLAVIVLLSLVLIATGAWASKEGMGQDMKIIYAYSTSCRFCDVAAVRALVADSKAAADKCSMKLSLEEIEVTKQADRAAELGVDSTPTAFVMSAGTTTRLEDGSVGGIRAHLEAALALCHKA